MLNPGCLSLALIFALLVLLPFFFAQLLLTALSKLGLNPNLALLVIIGIILGGALNIPVKKIPRTERYTVDPFAVFGMGRVFPRIRRSYSYTIIAVNVGGCLIPSMIALYQCFRVAGLGLGALLALVFTTTLNIVVCYKLARPLAGVGITMPALIPPLTAAIPSVILMPDFAPPIAFVAGVLGPLVGADLLHLRDISKIATGMASIGGAGTFDGIVLGGLLAAFLA
jgi:uncharacterized membrane protein